MRPPGLPCSHIVMAPLDLSTFKRRTVSSRFVKTMRVTRRVCILHEQLKTPR